LTLKRCLMTKMGQICGCERPALPSGEDGKQGVPELVLMQGGRAWSWGVD